VLRVLASGQHETPKPGDTRLARIETKIIASPQKSLEAAAAVASANGFQPVILGDSIEAEARELGFVKAGIARQVRQFSQPLAAPCALISGGETTVTVRGKGYGGRNVEYLLALALRLDGAQGISAIAADTDGVDGSREVAGAMLFPETLAHASAIGLDPWTALDNNDAHTFFSALGTQVITGPTLTNVNDFRAILIS
jgi:hydroxypyruvate reductase